MDKWTNRTEQKHAHTCIKIWHMTDLCEMCRESINYSTIAAAITGYPYR